jgi:tRNA isopentenyl-2-thiomethyl-A-37 hydroxylase MiaE
VRRAHEAIAIATRATSFDLDRMQHRIAHEPVMLVVDRTHGIRSVAQQDAAQVLGQLAADAQLVQRLLALHRREIALQIRVVRVIRRHDANSSRAAQ